MSAFTDALSGKTITTTKLSPFQSALSKIAPIHVRPPEINVPPQGLFRNLSWSDIGKGFTTIAKQVPGAVKDTFSIPTQIIKSEFKPSETQKKIEQLSGHDIFALFARPITRAASPIVEGLGTQIGNIIAQNEESRKIANEIPTRGVLPTPQLAPAGMGRITKEDVLDTVLNTSSVVLALAPVFSHYINKGSLALADLISEKSKVPITFSDLQKITTASSDAEAISRVGQTKFNAVREATQTNQVRTALKKGYVELAQTEPNRMANLLRNSATRPISEALNFTKQYGAKIETTTPPLLNETNPIITVEEARALPSEIAKKYVLADELGKPIYITKSLPMPTETLQLEAPKAGTPKVGEGFTATDKPNKEMVAKGKALNEYRQAVKDYNLKPTPTKLRTALKAKANWENVKSQTISFVEAQKLAPEVLKTLEPKVEAGKIVYTKPTEAVLPKVVKPTGSPIQQEGKITKVASDINTELANKGFESLPEDVLAKFSPITKKETVGKVAEFMTTNLEAAKTAAVTGDVPNGIHPQVLFNAIEEYATNKGDVKLLTDLASSPIATERSIAAQTLGASGFNKNPNSFVAKLQEINKAREAKTAVRTKQMGTILKKATQVKLTSEEKSIHKFLDDLAC